MNVWNFQIIEDLYDYIYFIEGDVVEFFGETKIKHQFHQPEDHQFYLVGTEKDLIDLKTILDDPDLAILYENHKNPYTYLNCTKDIFYNIDKYLKIENEICDINVLFSFYRNNINKDIVLDKIHELGIEALNEWDKKVLDEQLLYI